MTEHELEKRLRTALEHAAPDNLEKLLSQCTPQRQKIVPLTVPARPKRRRWTALAAACLVLVLAGAGAGVGFYQTAGAVASVVSLDVNPGVKLEVNRREKVLSAVALNGDADDILDGMELKGTDLNVAVNAIVGSLLKHGYVDELANSILISVEDSDVSRGEELEQRLAAEVEQVLDSAQVNGAILSQTVSSDAQLQQKADEYGISLGKASLIQSLVDNSSTLNFESLVGLSINELNLLANSTAVQTNMAGTGQTAVESNTSIHSSGTASQDAYIGAQAAQQIALAHAGVTAAQAQYFASDYDYEDGRMVYEVEFFADGAEYEYDIDAATGAIVQYEREQKQGGTSAPSATPSGGTDIGASAAKTAAFQNAGVQESEVTGLQVHHDEDDGIVVYEIEFRAGTTEFEYEISGVDGSVRSVQREEHSGVQTSNQGIDGQKALDIALQHAGVNSRDAGEVEIEDELDDDVPHYKVEFQANGVEYEYEIDAQSGTVLDAERD